MRTGKPISPRSARPQPPDPEFAEVRFRGTAFKVDTKVLERWLAESRDVQWDYKNLVRRKGRLERLK